MGGLSSLRISMTTALAASIIISATFIAGISFLSLYLIGTGAKISEVLTITASLVVLVVVAQYLLGPIILASSVSLRYLGPSENRFLEGVVAEESTRAGVPQPRIALVEDPAPNAFVFGRGQRSTTLAVHTGLLEALREDEVRAVVGHELGHVKHKDFIVVTMLSTIPLIAFIVGRIALEGTMIEGRRRKKEEDAGVVLLAMGLFSYAIYVLSLVVVRKLSRLRESYADAFSAYITDSPSSLISALVKITYGATLDTGSRGLRAFYLVDPPMAAEEMKDIVERGGLYDLNKDGVLSEAELEQAMEREAASWSNKMSTLFSTHPPTYKRIILLKAIEDEMRTSQIGEGQIYRRI